MAQSNQDINMEKFQIAINHESLGLSVLYPTGLFKWLSANNTSQYKHIEKLEQDLNNHRNDEPLKFRELLKCFYNYQENLFEKYRDRI